MSPHYDSYKTIIIGVDGGGMNSKDRNKNINAWAYHMEYRGNIKEDSGIIEYATSNIGELTAPIMALRTLRRFDIPVHIVSDSQYLVKGITEWVDGWIKNGWQNANGKKTSNKQLWIELVALRSQFKITWEHVNGHSGIAMNERCDELCTLAIAKYKRKNNV